MNENNDNLRCTNHADQAGATEQAPLLDGSADRPRRRSDGPPGSTIRRTSVASASNNLFASGFAKSDDRHEDETNGWTANTFKVVGIIIAGTMGWYVAYRAGAWKPLSEEGPKMPGDGIATGASILGYLSAVAYLL